MKGMSQALTSNKLSESIPRRPGGAPGFSSTFPSAGGRHNGHPGNTRSLRRRKQTDGIPCHILRAVPLHSLKRARLRTWRLQQCALCLHESLDDAFGQLRSVFDHTETVPHVHHLLESSRGSMSRAFFGVTSRRREFRVSPALAPRA